MGAPDGVVSARAVAAPGTLGVYVHFPYCLQKCPYCDFTSYATPREDVPHDAYADAVIRELELRATTPGFAGGTVRSIFFGGGTPSLWRPDALGRVVAAVRRALPVAEDLEVTAECNPSSLDAEVARGLADAGVNRLSVGVQSLRTPHLTLLGRLHDGPGALRALADARAAVPRVSADLIYGMPDHGVRELAEDLDAVLETGVEHVSAYALTIEPNTSFGDLTRKGARLTVDEDRFAELFAAVGEQLRAHGFVQYEISNHARPGAEARHNLVYWRGQPYLGLGVGAFGFHHTEAGGLRTRNALDPRAYLADPSPPDPSSAEPLGSEALVNEAILLGLRLAEGVDLAAVGARLGVDALGPRRTEIEKLTGQGLLAQEGTRLRIPPERWLLADHVIRRLMV